jgi:hypothetical protein
VGAGWRVQNEVLPALLAAGVDSEQITMLRKLPKPVLGHPTIRNYTIISDITPEEVSGSILICCIPGDEVFDTLSPLLAIGTPSSVLVDTPISSMQSELKALEWVHNIQIGILEDSVLIPWLSSIRDANPAIVRVRWAFSHYHGTALLSQLTNQKLVRITPWPLTYIIPWVFLDSNFRIFVLSGKQNQCRSRGFFFTRSGRLIREEEIVTAKEMETWTSFADANLHLFGISYLDAKNAPFKYISEWKCLGLALGMRALISGRPSGFPRIDKALFFERLSAWDYMRLIRLRSVRAANRIAEMIPGGKIIVRKAVRLALVFERLLARRV